MKLDINFKDLEILVSNMGAGIVEWKSTVKIETLKPEWKIVLETIGIDVDINDIEIMPNGLLVYPVKEFNTTEPHYEQILLYMKKAYYDYTYTFHFCDCDALKKKKNEGSFEKRYVATQRKDGFFLMNRQLSNRQYEQNKLEKLLACDCCLKWYNENYPKKNHKYTKSSFNIADFFEQFNNSPLTYKTINTDITAPASGYTKDWSHISFQLRKKHNWICTECKKNYESEKYQLDVHHINGIESDNNESNLKVLCKSCHANYHPHLK
jgi:hypothetical protein